MPSQDRSKLLVVVGGLLSAFVLSACASAPAAPTASVRTVPSETPAATSSPAATESRQAAFRRSLTRAIDQLEGRMLLFCAGHTVRGVDMPTLEFLEGLPDGGDLTKAVEAVLGLGEPPPGWLELSNDARDIALAADQAAVAALFLTLELKQGGSEESVGAKWSERVVAACDSTRAAIGELEEGIDKMPPP